jgi:hypothetical protein
MTELPKILLAHHRKTLKLPTFLRDNEKVARQRAAKGLDHVQFLSRLVEWELIDRERRMVERRIRSPSETAKQGASTYARWSTIIQRYLPAYPCAFLGA